MSSTEGTRRAHGTGSLIVVGDSYYGKWRVSGRQVKRKLGPVRTPSTRSGLTKAQAEAQLRRVIAEVTAAPVVERLTVQEVADDLLRRLVAKGRKPATLRGYRTLLRAQIGPRLGARPIARVSRDDVEMFMAALDAAGLAAHYRANALGLLHSIFEHAIRNEWATTNPCRYVDAPKALQADTAIRFLDHAEVEAVLSATPATEFGRVQRVLYLAAVMTGMRQGELLALRWRDVDWTAQRVRCSRTYTAGQFGTPKSRRGSRSVPLADRLGGELDRLHQASAYQADDDLVFGNPHTGRPLNPTTLTRTFQRALEHAGVRRVRFHDLRHTFGTRMAAAGVAMRTLQEWMGHEDHRTTLIYADYSPSAREVEIVNAAFVDPASTNPGTSLSATRANSDQLEPPNPLAVR